MTTAANPIGLSPVGTSLASAAQVGGVNANQMSIGSFAIGSLSSIRPLVEEVPQPSFVSLSIGSHTIGSISSFTSQSQSESFNDQAGLLTVDMIGLFPALRVGLETYSIGSYAIGRLSSQSEFINSAYEGIPTTLSLEVEGFWPSLAVENGQEFIDFGVQLQLSVEGLTPELIANQILGYDRRAIVRFLESSGGKPSLAPSADFPPIGMISFYDSSKFEMEQDDPAIKQTTDGGYVISRPRYLTKPKNTYQVQFTSVQEHDKELLEAFWNRTMGGSESFTFKTPFGKIVRARFAPSSPIKFVYKGQGYKRLWDATGIKIVEV